MPWFFPQHWYRNLQSLNFIRTTGLDFSVFGWFTNFSRQERIIVQMKLNSNEVQQAAAACKLNFYKKFEQRFCRPFRALSKIKYFSYDPKVLMLKMCQVWLTIYLQLDPVLHGLPLSDVVVGGGAREAVAVVAGLGVVQQHRLCEVVVRCLVNHLTFKI